MHCPGLEQSWVGLVVVYFLVTAPPPTIKQTFSVTVVPFFHIFYNLELFWVFLLLSFPHDITFFTLAEKYSGNLRLSSHLHIMSVSLYEIWIIIWNEMLQGRENGREWLCVRACVCGCVCWGVWAKEESWWTLSGPKVFFSSLCPPQLPFIAAVSFSLFIGLDICLWFILLIFPPPPPFVQRSLF